MISNRITFLKTEHNGRGVPLFFLYLCTTFCSDLQYDMFEIKPWRSLKGNSFTSRQSNINRDIGRNISYKNYEIKNTNDSWLCSKYGSFSKFGIESTDDQVVPDKELCLSPQILYNYTCLWNGVQQNTPLPGVYFVVQRTQIMFSVYPFSSLEAAISLAEIGGTCAPFQKKDKNMQHTCFFGVVYWNGAHVPPISANEIVAFKQEKG